MSHSKIPIFHLSLINFYSLNNLFISKGSPSSDYTPHWDFPKAHVGSNEHLLHLDQNILKNIDQKMM